MQETHSPSNELPQIQVYDTVWVDETVNEMLNPESHVYARPDELEKHEQKSKADEETAGVYDLIKDPGNKDEPHVHSTSDLRTSEGVQLQQYSELSHAFKETRKCFTLGSTKEVNGNYFELYDCQHDNKSNTLPRFTTTLYPTKTYASLGEQKSTSCQKIEGYGLNIYRENESNPSGEALIIHANESVHKSNVMIPKQKPSSHVMSEDESELPNYIEDVSFEDALSLTSATVQNTESETNDTEQVNKPLQDDPAKKGCINSAREDCSSTSEKGQPASLEAGTVESKEITTNSTHYDNCTLNFNPQYCKD